MASNLITQKIRSNSAKILSISVTVLLLLSLIAIFNSNSTIDAQLADYGVYNIAPGSQTPLRTFTSYTLMSLAPSPTGVNQTTTIYVFSNFEPAQVSGASYWGWNFTVTITDPNGVATTYHMPETLPTGLTYLAYTPTMIGTYKVQAHFAEIELVYTKTGSGSFIPGAYTYLASDSSVQNLIVQEQPVQAPPNTPLPAAYWQNPVYSTNYEWYSLVSNWLGGQGGGSPTTNTGPLSSHILWTKPLAFGGLSGGTQDGSPIRGDQGPGYNYYTGLLYQNKLQEFIIGDYFIYNIQPQLNIGVRCLNLRTGAVIWENDTMPNIAFANVPTYNMGLGSGSLAYLWFLQGGVSPGPGQPPAGPQTLYQIDAFTGAQITSYEHAQSMSPIQGPNGEILSYTLDYTHHWLALWNSTRAVQGTGSGSNSTASILGPTAGESYTPYSNKVRNWQTGIQWNVTIPVVNTPITGISNTPTFTFGQPDYADGVLVAVSNYYTNTTNPIWQDIGYSALTGAQLWAVNRTNIGWGEGGPESSGLYTFSGSTYGDGYYGLFERETLKWHIIDIKTGLETAVTPALNTLPGVGDWAFYDWHASIDNGLLFATGYSGAVTAFNVNTGANVWVWTPGNTGLETPFGTLPTYGGVTIANGVIYYGPTQHTPPTPMYKGYNLFAINESTGAEIWRIPAFFTSIAEASGVLTGYDGYDNQIYAFGKGLSATTVSAPQTEIAAGSTALITGTVTDQSAGQTSLGIPAAGTPAIADACMSDWMAYLYKQQPMPTNATGVQVTLSYVDPNNNYYTIGETSSDITGQFTYPFTPEIPGTYTITATFSGSNSYYASTAETHMYVGAGNPTTVAPTSVAPASVADTYFVPAIAGLFVLIIIVAIVLALLMLRKK